MSKKAMLVTATIMVRVVVDKNASDEDIIEAAKDKMVASIYNELSDNIDNIKDDLVMPYSDFDEK